MWPGAGEREGERDRERERGRGVRGATLHHRCETLLVVATLLRRLESCSRQNMLQ